MMNRLRSFGRFWFDFIVGDDWWIAVGVVAALAITYGLSLTAVVAWWVAPIALVVILPLSLWRATRGR